MKTSQELNAMSKAELVALVEEIQSRRAAPVKIYALSTTVHEDLVRFIKGRKLDVWNLVPKMPKQFTVTDMAAALRKEPSLKFGADTDLDNIARLHLNNLVYTGFLVEVEPAKPEAEKPAADKPAAAKPSAKKAAA